MNKNGKIVEDEMNVYCIKAIIEFLRVDIALTCDEVEWYLTI